MHLKALALAAVLPLVQAYPITADGVNCRTGPSTTYSVVKSYALNTEVELTCQTNGETVLGTTIWDKTTDDCYVTDAYVKTGSDGMVVAECEEDSEPPPDGGSEYNGPISRDEILERADDWVSQGVPYSMTGSHPDVLGRQYRTDCSGFVSMALHANSPGYSTVTLGEIAEAISYDDIQPGDFIGTLGDGTGGAGGHVVIFTSWTDDSKTAYNTVESKSPEGAVAFSRSVGWSVGSVVAEPFRYTRVTD